MSVLEDLSYNDEKKNFKQHVHYKWKHLPRFLVWISSVSSLYPEGGAPPRGKGKKRMKFRLPRFQHSTENLNEMYDILVAQNILLFNAITAWGE